LGLFTLQLESRQVDLLGTAQALGLAGKLAQGGLAATFYFCKGAVPLSPLPIYPSWRLDPPAAAQFLPWLAAAAIAGWLAARRTARAVWFGLGWFFLNLVPVLGFVGMAFLRIAPVSDHFAYLALPGLIGLAVAGWAAGLRRSARPGRIVLWSLAAAVAAGLAGEGRGYARVFRSEEALWSHALARNPGSWMAHFNLANTLRGEGRVAEAIPHYRAALRLRPGSAEGHANFGVALAQA